MLSLACLRARLPFARLWHGQHGQSLVEFALVVPLLMFMMIFIVDLGRAVNAYVTVSSASREGAHFAMLHPTASPGAISSAVAVRLAPLDPAQVTVASSYRTGGAFASWPPGGVPASAPQPTAVPIRVEASYSWAAVTFVLGQFMPSRTFTTSSTVEVVR